MQKCENMKMSKSIVFALMLTIAAQVAWAASAQDIHPAPAGAQPTVEGVIAKIDAIGEVTYPGSEEAIDEAQSTYNALTEDEKALVINYGVLRTAQELYAVLEVIAKIDAIGEVTGESKALITAAREAYDALTAGQKTLVTNYAALFEAETAYADLSKSMFNFVSKDGSALISSQNKSVAYPTEVTNWQTVEKSLADSIIVIKAVE